MRRAFISSHISLFLPKGGVAFALPFLVACCLLGGMISSNAFAGGVFSYKAPAFSEALKAQWYVLNHYNAKGISEIQNADFFLTPRGQYNPEAEYKAFIDLLQRYDNYPQERDLTTLCHYPARITLIARYSSWVDRTLIHSCIDYIDERKPDQIASISLMYASGYFDSPSSYYGHTLLRLNYDDSVKNKKTLDASINYGAAVTDNSGGLSYIIKGLFGLYDGTYHANNDFLHSHRYTNAQLRDLWEYELRLTPTQIRFISEHSWELKRAQFAYYFFNDNCAHRILDLIERATGSEFNSSHGFWLTPLQAVRGLTDDHSALLTQEVNHPSLKSVFTNGYRALSSAEKKQVEHFLRAPHHKHSNLAQDLPRHSLLLLLDYYDILLAQLTIKQKTDPQAKQDLHKARRVLLYALLTRDKDATEQDESPSSASSLMTLPKTSVLRAGYALHSHEDNKLTIRYQIANNDLLDTPQPGQERSRFLMGALELEAPQNDLTDITIRDVTLIDLANLNTNPFAMDVQSSYSWGFRLGYNGRDPLCSSCHTLNVKGGLGKAHRFSDSIMTYALAGVQINHRQVDSYDYISAHIESGVLIDHDAFGFDISLDSQLNPFNGERDMIGSLEAQYRVNASTDIRIESNHNFEGDERLSLRLGYYFN